MTRKLRRNKWVCGPDGQWFRDYSPLLVRRYAVYQVVSSAKLVP